ncbi:hypothetical protein JL720_10335 [Aureococcus anophagefferens]|nr:hypothetical protein JL720_10335 [Aureococcus anophagefferens]
MEEWAKRAYRRMVPSKRALSLRVAGYVAAAGAGADVVRRVLDREPGVAREADVLSKERRTMLHAAAAAGNGAALAPLLRAGADPARPTATARRPAPREPLGRAACVAASRRPARPRARRRGPSTRATASGAAAPRGRARHAAAVAALLAARTRCSATAARRGRRATSRARSSSRTSPQN